MSKNKISLLLIEVMQDLLNGQSINVAHLSMKYDIPGRTIRSNISTIIQPLFPDSIYYDNATRIWISRENLREKTTLSAKELISLQKLKNHASSFDDELFVDAFKLLNKFEQGVFKNEIVRRSRKEKLSRDDELLMTMLLNAIRQKKKVSCIYNNKHRTIEPLMVVMLEGYWYLHLFDIEIHTGTKKSKNFHIKTMESTSLLDEDFSYPDLSFFRKLRSSVNAYFDSDSLYKTVELEIDKEIVKYFERIPISPKQKLYAGLSNNYMTLSIEVTNLNEIVPIIQQYLPKIKVIYPPELNEIIKDNIGKYNIC